MNNIFSLLLSYISPIVVIIIIISAYSLNNWFFNRKKQAKGTISRQLISVLIFILGALLFAIVLPIDQSIKAQIISLIGIVLSAALALSSTTIIGNALAGLMNDSIQNLTLGDLIKIENHFGRVTKKGLFRTEIQNEDRNLTSLPNLYLASHPIKIVRESGTIISTTVSLGYDVNQADIKNILLDAANKCNLTEPYVYIVTLGDFSITYKIHGLLADINKYFTTQSLLNEKVIEQLHKNGIEIVSPTFMNQRQVNDKQFIPTKHDINENQSGEKSPENIVFDKAIEADKIEQKTENLEKIETEISELKKKNSDLNKKEKIEKLEVEKENLEKNIEVQKEKLDEHK